MTSILVQLGKITIQAILVSVYLNPGETLTPYVLQNLLVPPLLAADHRCPHHKLGPGFKLHHAPNNILFRLSLNGPPTFPAVRMTYPTEEKAQIILYLSDRAHGGPGIA